MRKKGFFIILATLLCLSACKKQTWRERTYDNLNLIRAHILTEAPGPVDAQNPAFMMRLNKYFHIADDMAIRVRNRAGYNAVLQYFVNNFHDVNIRLSHLHFPPPLFYPGFILRYNGKTAEVSSEGHLSQANVPPIGAQLQNCQGDSYRRLMQKNIFPFFGNPKLVSDWYLETPRLLVDLNNPFVKWPATCEFRYQGKTKTYPLKWHDTSDDNIHRYFRLAAYHYQPRFNIHHLTPAVVWINWPTFSPNTNEALMWMRKIIRLLPRLRDDKVIILDLRGNSGGEYSWGKNWLQGLYGKLYYDYIAAKTPTFYRQYRVSEYAIHAAESEADTAHRLFGSHAVEWENAKKKVTDLQAAFERGDQLYPTHAPVYVPPVSEVVPSPLFSGKLVLMTDGRCNNACLNFITVAKQFPKVLVFGQTTGANTEYTDAKKPIDLNDGVQLHFGYAIQRRRDRGINQAIVPNKRYSGDISDTQALKAWALHQIMR